MGRVPWDRLCIEQRLPDAAVLRGEGRLLRGTDPRGRERGELPELLGLRRPAPQGGGAQRHPDRRGAGAEAPAARPRVTAAAGRSGTTAGGGATRLRFFS